MYLFLFLFAVVCLFYMYVLYLVHSHGTSVSINLHLSFTNLMDTEIVDYHDEEYSLQAFPPGPVPDSVLFSMHGNSSSSSSERLQEMGVANHFVSGVAHFKRNINLNAI